MECMEEGYLAKIVLGDGAKEIKVGEVHAYSWRIIVLYLLFRVIVCIFYWHSLDWIISSMYFP
jgi:hypothetical protein